MGQYFSDACATIAFLLFPSSSSSPHLSIISNCPVIVGTCPCIRSASIINCGNLPPFTMYITVPTSDALYGWHSDCHINPSLTRSSAVNVTCMSPSLSSTTSSFSTCVFLTVSQYLTPLNFVSYAIILTTTLSCLFPRRYSSSVFFPNSAPFSTAFSVSVRTTSLYLPLLIFCAPLWISSLILMICLS